MKKKFYQHFRNIRKYPSSSSNLSNFKGITLKNILDHLAQRSLCFPLLILQNFRHPYKCDFWQSNYFAFLASFTRRSYSTSSLVFTPPAFMNGQNVLNSLSQ